MEGKKRLLNCHQKYMYSQNPKLALLLFSNEIKSIEKENASIKDCDNSR